MTHLAQPPGEKVYNDQEDDCGDENLDVSPHIRTERCHCSLQSFQRHRSVPQSSSASRLHSRREAYALLSFLNQVLSGIRWNSKPDKQPAVVINRKSQGAGHFETARCCNRICESKAGDLGHLTRPSGG